MITKYLIISYKEIKNIDSIKVIGGFNDIDDAKEYIKLRKQTDRYGFTFEIVDRI